MSKEKKFLMGKDIKVDRGWTNKYFKKLFKTHNMFSITHFENIS